VIWFCYLHHSYDEWFYASAFAHPQIIICKNEAPADPVESTWGLVPGWAKAPEANQSVHYPELEEEDQGDVQLSLFP
jgi:putative SOS response-associated peptidase YedK